MRLIGRSELEERQSTRAKRACGAPSREVVRTSRDEGGGAAREEGGGAKRCGDARPSSGAARTIVPTSPLSRAARFLTAAKVSARIGTREGLPVVRPPPPRVEPVSRRAAPVHRLPSGCKRRRRSRRRAAEFEGKTTKRPASKYFTKALTSSGTPSRRRGCAAGAALRPAPLLHARFASRPGSFARESAAAVALC